MRVGFTFPWSLFSVFCVVVLVCWFVVVSFFGAVLVAFCWVCFSSQDQGEVLRSSHIRCDQLAMPLR